MVAKDCLVCADRSAQAAKMEARGSVIHPFPPRPRMDIESFYSYRSRDCGPWRKPMAPRLMLPHADIWNAVDRLAARAGLSASGLARKAGLDPTTFNRSKRVTPQGRPRGP